MKFSSRNRPAAGLTLGMLALGIAGASGVAQASDSHVAPAITRMGKSLGLESPSAQLNLTVWLNPHNQAALDARVKELYTPGSPTFHKWLTNSDLKAYMPTAAEAAAVEKELTAHNLKVTAMDPLNLSVHFTGKVSDVESAFHTQISRYLVKGQAVETTSVAPQLSGTAAGLVHSLGGVDSMKAKALYSRPLNPRTKKPYAGIPVTKDGKTNGIFFSGQCFYAPASTTLTGVNAFDGVTPVTETLTGLTYGANPGNTEKGTLAPCGYSSSEVQGFYGMKTAYGRGYTGTGQTVAIVDVGTQPTAMSDANVFNRMNGLPLFNSTNFTLYNPYGANQTGFDEGTDIETDIDVQWAHSMAPGASIALVEAFSFDIEDLQSAIYYAAQNSLGNVISVSYGEPEYFTGPFAMSVFNYIAEFAASKGISIQVSTGDDGDYTVFGIPADVNGIASSPFDTAVGGTSIGVDPVTQNVYQFGWGTNIAYFTFGTGYIVDPPTDYSFFNFGSGGGSSSFFSKPGYQSALPGSQRLLPDVSALADPFTGAEIVYDDPYTGDTYVTVYGGTSLAAPIFSGMWAVLNEYAGAPLGQAAPYVAATPYPLLTDVLPLNGPDNATATVTDPMGTTTYSAMELSQPLYSTTGFVSAIWDADTYGDYYNITFGTDSSLTVTQGWDNVTGYGTPNMGAIFSALP